MNSSLSPDANPKENTAPAQEYRPADQPLSGETVPKPAVTILLVDDDPMVREIGRLMLIDLGFNVLTAADGTEAVDLFRAHNEEISLVFCDQIMPGMDGWQTLAALHEINPAIPVIMASGIAQSQGKTTKSNLQPRGYLNKPYTMATLGHALDQGLNHGERAV